MLIYVFHLLLISALLGESALDSEICRKLPTRDQIKSMSRFSNWAPECVSSAGTHLQRGCPSIDDRTDWTDELAILVEPIKCIVHACSSDNVDESLQHCSQKLLSQFRNVLQSRPDDFEKQVRKACKCNYQSVTELRRQTHLGPISVDDFSHAYNCEKNSEKKACVNPIIYLEEQKVCLAPKEGFYPLEYFEMFKPNPYHHVEETAWNEKCKNFTWLKGRIFYSGTVHFLDVKGVWHSVHQQCREFRHNQNSENLEGQFLLPNLFNWVPFPRELVDESEVYAALHSCCKNSEYYENFSEADDSNRHMAGVFETFCLSKKKVIMGLTFFDWMIRGLIHKYSDVSHTTFDQFKHDGVEEMTSHSSEAVQQLKLHFRDAEHERHLDSSDIFWFLQYVTDNTAKRFALRACIVGSKLGRAVTILPGLVMSLEAHKYATTTEDLPDEHRLLAMMTYHTCAVFASVHANEYFDHDSDCNDFALNSFYSGSKERKTRSEL
ncbi:uncharacterized protein LOC142345538 isoform X3 [Convolutriloba macropyga]|uniref:uncharacterized protein LOC142345538 isoform X3 n=1 Tax=Convolutriloba macropyga TaxID=536237 RepID=UPI003F524FC5